MVLAVLCLCAGFSGNLQKLQEEGGGGGVPPTPSPKFGDKRTPLPLEILFVFFLHIWAFDVSWWVRVYGPLKPLQRQIFFCYLDIYFLFLGGGLGITVFYDSLSSQVLTDRPPLPPHIGASLRGATWSQLSKQVEVTSFLSPELFPPSFPHTSESHSH